MSLFAGYMHNHVHRCGGGRKMFKDSMLLDPVTGLSSHPHNFRTRGGIDKFVASIFHRHVLLLRVNQIRLILALVIAIGYRFTELSILNVFPCCLPVQHKYTRIVSTGLRMMTFKIPHALILLFKFDHLAISLEKDGHLW